MVTPFQHLKLLLRFDRTFNLRNVIKERVNKGDRVLDAGCGMGILSQWAVQAGAERVDAVDLSDLTLAKELAAENGLGDKIRFLRQDLREFMANAPEMRYDCIIAMVYLNDPRRDESQTEIVRELKSKLLRPGGSMVPDRLEYSFAVCDWPDQDRVTRETRIHDQVTEIEGRYGLSFTRLKEHLNRTPCHEHFPIRGSDGRLDLRGSRLLSPETPAFEIDYSENKCSYPSSSCAETATDGYANTVLWWQRIIANNKLIFTNQSVGWVANPQSVSRGKMVRFELDDQWRKHNLLALEC